MLRKSDNTTKEIHVVEAGGIADTADHQRFCGSAVCIVQRIFSAPTTKVSQLHSVCLPPADADRTSRVNAEAPMGITWASRSVLRTWRHRATSKISG